MKNTFIYLFCFFSLINFSSCKKEEVTSPQIPVDGLLAYYPFNGNVQDESGNGNNAENFGATLSTDRSGNGNSAYQFDGVSSYINTHSTFDFENRTISLWFKADKVDGINPDNHVVITQDDISLMYGIIRIDIDQGLLKLWAGGFAGTYTLSSTTVGSWYHILLVREGNLTRYYINGTKVSEGSADSEASSVNANSKLIIGAGRTTINQYFKGKIDDIRIYNRALTDSEITLLYNE